MMDKDRVESAIISQSKDVERIVVGVVNKFCSELDKLHAVMKEKILEKSYTVEELEHWALVLPIFSYEIGERQEIVGIREDMAKMVKEEVYNRIFLDAGGSVQAKKSEAEIQTTMEQLYHTAYARAYRIIRQKNEATLEIINSIKKILSRQLEEKR